MTSYNQAFSWATRYGWGSFQGRLVVVREVGLLYHAANRTYHVEDIEGIDVRLIVGRIAHMSEHREYNTGAPIKLLGSGTWVDGSATPRSNPLGWGLVVKFVPDEFLHLFEDISFREFVKRAKQEVEAANIITNATGKESPSGLRYRT